MGVRLNPRRHGVEAQIIPLRPRPVQMAGEPARARRELDPFSIGDQASSALRQSPESRAIAARMAVLMGPRTAIVEDYLDHFSCAPSEYLEVLRASRTAVIFAPTIPGALNSPLLNTRRGRVISAEEISYNERRYSREEGTAAVYDAELDALILPTSYAAADAERVVLHELGHALTYHRALQGASHRAYLLMDLPGEIAAHVACYTDEDPDLCTAVRVLEVLAEAFVFLVVGRADELPRAVTSELIGMLPAVGDRRAAIDFDLDALSGRTATRVSQTTLRSYTDVEEGHRFVAPPCQAELLPITHVGDPALLAEPIRVIRPAA